MNTNLETLNDFFKSSIFQTILQHGIPLVPFPQIQKCLGLEPKDSSMEIREGYAILAYDFTVENSHPDCLFNMTKIEPQKLSRKDLETMMRDLKKPDFPRFS